MKRRTVLWAVTAAAAWACTAAGFTVTLDRNYAGAPANTVVETDAYGCLIGAPLPVPTREGQAFTGWFTTATGGGSRVLTGASGTKFTRDATVYARWADRRNSTVNDMPACMKASFDWLKNERHQREEVFNSWNYNFVFDQIFAGEGTVNYAVRWESARDVTLQERRNIAAMLHEQINKWTRRLIGFEDWPFQEIPVTVVGWAVADPNRILDRQPNENVYTDVNNSGPTDMDGILQPSLPKELSRFLNYGTANYRYPGGLHERFDMYLWATAHDFGAAGHGGGWGQRLGDAAIINMANAAAQGSHDNSMVLAHEQGHSFGFYDFYGAAGTDRPPQTPGCDEFGKGDLRTVMHMGSNISTQSDYDGWMIRYYWNWLRTGSPESRFKMPAPPAGVTPPIAARAARRQAPQFRFDNRGTLRYDLDGARSANLTIFDCRGRLLKTVRLDGSQNTAGLNVNPAAQTLLWKAEIDGRAAGQGRIQMTAGRRP